MSIKYYPNGQPRWNGHFAYHPDGQVAYNGTHAYFSNGNVAWNGSFIYYESGQLAWNGIYAYFSNGQVASTEADSWQMSLGNGFTVRAQGKSAQLSIDGRQVT